MTDETWDKIHEQQRRYAKKHKRCGNCACWITEANIKRCCVKNKLVYSDEGRFCKYHVPKYKECD